MHHVALLACLYRVFLPICLRISSKRKVIIVLETLGHRTAKHDQRSQVLEESPVTCKAYQTRLTENSVNTCEDRREYEKRGLKGSEEQENGFPSHASKVVQGSLIGGGRAGAWEGRDPVVLGHMSCLCHCTVSAPFERHVAKFW